MAQHFVVLPTQLGPAWRRGQVVSAQQILDLAGSPERVAHLVRRGALRAATEEEARHERIDLAVAQAALSVQDRLAQLEEENRHLRSEVSKAEREVQLLRAARQPLQAVPPVDPDRTNYARLIQDKDKVIADLQQQLNEFLK